MKTLQALAAFLAVLPLAAAAGQSPLTATETAIARAADAHNAEALALLERIVNINSGTMNFSGVRQVGDVLRAELDALGFVTRWDDGSAFRRAGHLVAEHRGPGPKLLLIGHLDTVFEPNSPFQRFERIDDSTAKGPGVIDMKGGDVIIVAALRALKDAGQLERMNVVVVFDGDEEDAGRPLSASRKTLIDAAAGAAAAIGANRLPHAPAERTFDDGYPPMAPTAGNKRLLALYDRGSRDLGFGAVTAVDPSRAGAADVAFVATLVPMSLDGIGLSGHDDH